MLALCEYCCGYPTTYLNLALDNSAYNPKDFLTLASMEFLGAGCVAAVEAGHDAASNRS